MKESVKHIASLKLDGDRQRIVFQKNSLEPFFVEINSPGELNNIIQALSYACRVVYNDFEQFEINDEDNFYQYISQKVNNKERLFIGKSEFLIVFEGLKSLVTLNPVTGTYIHDNFEIIDWQNNTCKSIIFRDKGNSHRLDLFQNKADYFSDKDITLSLFDTYWKMFS